jgi:regulatory protein
LGVKANPAYLDGLKLLARRELSEAQVRQRLARREHSPEAIDDAVARLRQERAIDDARVAEAIARTQTSVHRRGKARVRLEIERAGVDQATARRAVEAAFAGVDDDGLLEAAVTRRLRGHETIEDERTLQRLYRYLVGQGFEADRVAAVLGRRRKKLRIED